MFQKVEKFCFEKKNKKLQKKNKDDAPDVKKVGLSPGWKWGFGTRPEELHQVH